MPSRQDRNKTGMTRLRPTRKPLNRREYPACREGGIRKYGAETQRCVVCGGEGVRLRSFRSCLTTTYKGIAISYIRAYLSSSTVV